MTQISIRELHLRTGEWVRKAAGLGEVIVLDRGRPVAKLLPTESQPATPFSQRTLVPGFASLPKTAGNSSTYLEDERR